MSRNVPCTDLPAGETPASRIVSAARQLVANGMNRGSSGNISIRRESADDVPEGFFITPSGVDPARMEPDNICIMRMTGENGSTGKPSSEWRIHRDIYAARPDVHAIVHTHSPFATTLACMQLEVPPFHYMIAVTGDNTIPCAPYALFGSQELSDTVLATLGERYACLMAHHGMIALGHSLEHAMAIAIEVESLCEQYWRILQTGHIKLLSDAQMAQVHEKFKDYFRK